MTEIERLIQLMAKLPGLGPRSARRAVLTLLKRRETMMLPLMEAMQAAADAVCRCAVCGNLDSVDPCRICTDSRRDAASLCVVEDVADLWALERAGCHRGRYHVLGGVLSALDGVGPEDLGIRRLVARAEDGGVREVILALSFTVDGQATAHYIADALRGLNITLSGIAHGVPLGGELHYLDDATLTTALGLRRGLDPS
jgi:recombination protein RecR